MLALLVNSLGFTPGLRPAPFIESPVAMRFRDVDFGGVFMKSALPRSCGSPLKSLVSELQDINKIDEQNIQKLVSCPELAPPSVSATRPAFWLFVLWHLFAMASKPLP